MEEKRVKKKKEKALEDGDMESFYTACKDLGDYYLESGNFDKALNEYKEAERKGLLLRKNIYVAIANRMIGEALLFTGEFEKAIKHQKIHLDLSQKEGYVVEEQRALTSLGRAYFIKAESIPDENEEWRKSLESSREYYLKSIDICENLNSEVGHKQVSEMKSRSFYNLSLTVSSLGCKSSAFEFISKAIAIDKKWEFWENLCRCYKMQAGLYMKMKPPDTSAALSSYGEALKIAARLDNKSELSCELLGLKAEVLVELLDFKSAKNCLIQAYKIKPSDQEVKEDVERKLRVVAVMCQTESKLLKTSENDYKQRKKINEILGDCCVALKRFGRAIDYYEKMLKFSLKLGEVGKDLAAAYVSLSQTYKDDKQYDLALKYFYLELKLYDDDPAEACKTQMNIMEMMDLNEDNFKNIKSEYAKARYLAKKARDKKLEIMVLRTMISIQRNRGIKDAADTTEEELNILKTNLPEGFSESEEFPELEDISEQIGVDINLDDLSGMESDDNESFSDRPVRKKSKLTVFMKRNEKGEYPLHVAVIKGNINQVKTLLKQGHPVNIQDAAGWSPLHEACNHGYENIVEALLDAGANIDDRGGPKCEGVTPIHDAASNGHLEVIELLLDRGASPLVRTDKGETVLDCLNAWHDRAVSENGKELDPITFAHFDSVVSTLQDALNKAGYNTSQSSRSSSKSIFSRHGSSLMNLDVDKASDIIKSRKYLVESSTRNQLETDDDILYLGRRNCIEDFNAAVDYKQTIESMKRKDQNHKPPKEITAPRNLPAFLNDDDVQDDWLEDDMQEELRRPAKRKCEEFIGGQLRESNKIGGGSGSFRYKSSDRFGCSNHSTTSQSGVDNIIDLDIDENTDRQDENDIEKNMFNEDDDDFDSLNHFPPMVPEIQNKPRRMKYQKSLLSVGFKRFAPSNSSTQNESSSNVINDSNYQSNSLSSLQSNNYNISKQSSTTSTIKSVKVRIEGTVFFVPIPTNSRETSLNIGWLVSEVTRRYHKLEGVTPVLTLTTNDGALLDENDPLSAVIDDKELQATVMSWNLAPLVDRYKEACAANNTALDSHIELQLDMCQASSCLSIKDCLISTDGLLPALKAISHHYTLTQIILSGINLEDQAFKHVIDSIIRLSQLQLLDVQMNNITFDGLSYFSHTVSQKASIQTLESINLNFNPIGDESASCLAKLTQNLPHLRKLSVRCVGITSQSLYTCSNFNLDCIESLDVSYNHLEREGIAKFLSAMNGSGIKDLNFSSTGGPEIVQECILFFERSILENLVSLNLSNLNLDDTDVINLLQSLYSAEQISELNLSRNVGITSNSYNYFSNLKTLRKLYLDGCKLTTNNSSQQLHLPFCQLTISSKENLSNFKEAPYNYHVNAQCN